MEIVHFHYNFKYFVNFNNNQAHNVKTVLSKIHQAYLNIRNILRSKSFVWNKCSNKYFHPLFRSYIVLWIPYRCKVQIMKEPYLYTFQQMISKEWTYSHIYHYNNRNSAEITIQLINSNAPHLTNAIRNQGKQLLF